VTLKAIYNKKQLTIVMMNMDGGSSVNCFCTLDFDGERHFWAVTVTLFTSQFYSMSLTFNICKLTSQSFSLQSQLITFDVPEIFT